MLNRIDRTFSQLKRARRKALIGYITAGFPNKASFPKLVPLLEKAGLDLMEIGVPFSDPIADGPTIQHSSQMALANGVTLEWILNSVKALRERGIRLPLILMSYCNPIYSMGIETFFRKAKSAGVDGLIIPDMIPEEAEAYARSSQKYGIHVIYLAAPTTPPNRIRTIARKTRGFLYAVSLTGVTGVRKAVPEDVERFLKSVRSACRKPIAVGFGFTTPHQVRSILPYADGVIIGSALIREIEKSKRSGFQGAVRFVRSLKGAFHAS
jgi:tryptophan synthase alpha chain